MPLRRAFAGIWSSTGRATGGANRADVQLRCDLHQGEKRKRRANPLVGLANISPELDINIFI
jgi:hypothetical protein